MSGPPQKGSIILLAIILLLQPAFGWKTAYHAQMCEKALLQADNTGMEKEAFLAGCKAPDNEREAYPPHHATKNMSRIEAYFLSAREELGTGDIQKASFHAGVVAHYIADFASPAHNKADPDCHAWIEDTMPGIYAVSAERKTVGINELLESTANHSKTYAQELSEHCKKNDTEARDTEMQKLASYSAFNIALMLDSVGEYAPPQKIEMEKYAVTDHALRAEEKKGGLLPAAILLAALLLMLRKR